MLIMALKPGHDGSVAVVEDGQLLWCLIGAGYVGEYAVREGRMQFFGQDVEYFTSSYERSNLMMALGMALLGEHELMSVLVWEGVRVQSVTPDRNPALHALLDAFAVQTSPGVLCSTSLNLSRRGFINRMSDLARYCEDRGIADMVVGDDWYRRQGARD